MCVVAAYVALVLLVVLTAALRRGPTLWRATSLLRLNAVFLLVAAGCLLATRDAPPLALSLGALAPPALLAAVRRRWWFLRMDPGPVARELEASLARVRLPAARTGSGYLLQQRDAPPLALEIRGRPGPWTVATIGRGPRTRKTRLALDLLAKQFAGLLPRVRVRLGD